MRAVAEDDAQALKALLAQGTDVNCRNQSGQTPLMMAALLGHSAIVPVLLESGADVRLRDNHGLSALEWSQRRGFADITELLINALPIDTASSETAPHSNEDFRARAVSELGPAATAILKAAHAQREADAARQRNAAAESVSAATDQQPVPEAVSQEELNPPPADSDIHKTMTERERLFREAARQRIEDELQKRADQELASKPSIETHEQPLPAIEPVSSQAVSSREPETADLIPQKADAAPLPIEPKPL